MDRESIAIKLRENDIPFPEKLPEKLETYFQLLLEWNARMDLVAGAGETELLDRHMTDSLTVLRTDLLEGCSTLIDVGTGAGFPGMVLAMAIPGMQVTLLDSQRKRLDFLREVMDRTRTENVTLLHARAEDGARRKDLRERFDAAAARAVAPLNTLCEYLLPYVRIGGRALCWKGPALAQEREAGRRAAFLLGGRLGDPIQMPIAGRDWEHVILPVDKISKTPASYPRKAGTPKSKPLAEQTLRPAAEQRTEKEETE